MSRIKRTMISGKARNYQSRQLELLTINIGGGRQHKDPVTHNLTFTKECKNLNEARFILKKVAWGLAGSQEEIDEYLKEIKENGTLTFDGVSIEVTQFMGDK